MSLIRAPRAETWLRAFASRLLFTDTLIVVATVFTAQALRFGLSTEDVLPDVGTALEIDIAYTAISVVVAAGWLAALAVYGTRDLKVIGNGSTEYRRVADASLRFFGVLAILAFVFKLQIARGYLLLALPIGIFLLLVSRWAWRNWLAARRQQGGFVRRALVVGEHDKARHVAEQIVREPDSGIVVVGALTDSLEDELSPSIPRVGGFDDVSSAISGIGADTVVFAGSDSISPARLRELGWDLESRRVDLIVAPALTDIAGPRIHARQVAGLPLIHVDYPSFTGIRYATKRAFDIVVSAMLLILLSPVLLTIALLVRRDGHPALFRQQRIGHGGRDFAMIKFRSMTANAEKHLASLLDQNEGNGVLFKMKDDPRITKIGKTLRRYSLDELPQLWNVLRGDMSLVGPRPPLASEVARYGDWMRRRFLVKPGITGLWQVSGRSNLSWDESVRLDLYYVENWSLTTDFLLLWRTVRAVTKADGAY
ncbi:sugar transferase [Microbacterium esteraromaticum]|uniref:Sugar transferase n=1 Tax=Microbacterium esteraromaticum TaxID=57043 RepID=A0A7D7W8I1_9MICO|nr:sugar transferase [Microbacterium esteraromaticum]QMU97416.1 sugar transferase [Microbacterium esteraromaticum]